MTSFLSIRPEAQSPPAPLKAQGRVLKHLRLCVRHNDVTANSQAPNITEDASRMISAKQIKAARVFLEWEQRDLAHHSGLSLPTIQRMEKLGVGRSSADNAVKVQAALEAGGVVFIAENGDGAGVRVRKEPK
jgi:hypothetical protein